MPYPTRPAARAALLALATILFTGSAARAQGVETGGVRIDGAVRNQIVTGPGATVASGVNSRASTAVGSIAGGVRINGRLDVTVQTGAISSLATGVNDQVRTSVGSVTEDVTGQTDVVISTGQIINMSDRGSRRPACVVIGTLGKVPGC